MCASMPTGSGKSLLAVLSAHLASKRVSFNTVTKGLQAQLSSDFHRIGMEDIRGQNSYPCILQADQEVTVDQGACHSGIHCSYKDNGCLYYDQLARVRRSKSVVTNYAYWLAQTNYSDGIGPVGLLVCDEAHLAFNALESFLRIDFTNNELQSTKELPPTTDLILDWKGWALMALDHVAEEEEKAKQRVADKQESGEKPSSRDLREVRHWGSLKARMETLFGISGHWIIHRNQRGVGFIPVWPGAVKSDALFHNINKVLVMSATLTEKTVASLGIAEGDYQFMELPSYYPPRNSPVIHVKTVRMNHRATDMDLRMWVNRIDQLISRRLDRKGIVYTVSYDRRNMLMSHSQYAGIMQTHSRDDVFDAVERFKASPAPAVLVSPTITSGWDFPDTECEYVIVGKIPYPDSTDPVVKARQKDDDEWTSFLAMETLVQVAGRGTRSETDKCEVIIIDDSWFWFWKRYQKFAPQFFKDRVLRRSFDLVPDPLV